MPPVRESRHLWIGNIPDSITEEKLVEHFQRYGRIDSVKILAKRSVDGGQAAFVDFVDIRCAIKAHKTPNRLGDRELRTDYNEPASTTLARSHAEQPRRYEHGGRGPGDEGYSTSRQNNDGGYQGNYPYKDEAPARRDYERVESSEQNASRITEESPRQYQEIRNPVVKAKDSDSGQSGSGTALSGSGSDSSDSGDSDSESDSDSSVSENSKAVKKTKALQIRNLSSRSTDATIREGLYHEFKKHGDVGHIKVVGRDNNRHAIVCFRRHEDVTKAMDSCRGKMFLGLEMELTPCEDDEYEGSFHHYRRRSEGGSASFGNADDVYMFNATRTIFVGNIERNATSSELKRMFERYGEIVDVDIKKQGSNGAYAFIQYLDITHAVEARKQMNRALSGRNRLKIGFGKGMPTSTIWIGGLIPTVTEQMLERHFQRYGRVNRVGLDQEKSYAMVTFDNLDGSTMAHNDVKSRAIFGKRVRVDYASRESQHFFYDHLANTGQGDGRRYEPSPPPANYRPRSGNNNKSYEEPTVRSRTGGIKQDNRGSKYHPYDERGYERGPGFNEGGRRHYDEYYRGPPPAGGYESDDFGQELREYNVTRERERERERAREREQDRRQEPPPPRRRHHRETTTGRHEGNTESEGERYYSRGEHSDVWLGDSGKDRASRESSLEPRDDGHRRGDKRRDGDKRRGDEKRGQAKGRYEGQSEEDLEPIEKQPPEKKEHREKNLRKKPMEPREDYGKPEFYPTSYEKGYDGKEKDATLKRDVKQERDIQGGTSAEEGGKVSMEEGKGDVIVKEEKVRNRKEERSAEKAMKKMKNKEGKKKRKIKKSPVEVPPASVPSAQGDSDGVIDGTPHLSRDNIPQSRVDIPESRVEIPQSHVEIPQSREIPRSRAEIPQSRVELPHSRVEIPQSRVELPHSRVEIPQSRVELPHSRVEIPQSRVELPHSRVEIPQSRVELPHSRVEIPQSRVQISQSRMETPHSRVEIPHSRVEKREEPIKEYKKTRKSGTSLKSAVVVKNVSENSDKDRRQYRDNRRPKSPSPQDHPEEHISRKRPRSPERDGEHHHVDSGRHSNTKHADSGRHSNGDHDDPKRKKRRQSNEATPPPPPPPPPPHHHSSRSTQQSDPRKFAKERNKDVSSSSRDSSARVPPNNVGQSASDRSSRDTSTFQPHVSDTAGPRVSSAETTKHVTSAQISSNTSPTDSPVPTQTRSGPVPNSDDTLMELLRRHPVMWQGLLGLKNDSAAIQMHYVSGNGKLAEYSLPKPSGGVGTNGLAIPPVLRIAQRMRMEASQLEGVTKRMQLEKEHCLLLALPCGRDPLDVHAQTRALKNGFIAYLQQKLAAGIINIAQPGSQQASFVLHVFPPCEFTHSHLSRVAPNLLDSATDSGHLMVVVATV